MDKKKEIKIDPSFFSYSSSNGGKGTTKKKREKKNVSKKELISVKNKDVKELLLQKLKEYKKKKTREKTNIEVNDLKKNINNDFLQKIKQKKNKTENNILNDDFNKNIIDLNKNEQNEFVSSFNHEQKKEIPVVKENLVVTQNNIPEYGILKNSSKPTFREYMRKNSINSNLDTDIPKIKKNKKKEEKIQLHVEKKYICGKNKTKKKIGIFIKNNKLRRDNEEKKFEIKKTNFRTVKNYLKKNNLIKYGSSAPSDLLREIYENSKICGDINNINGDSLVHNYINNED